MCNSGVKRPVCEADHSGRLAPSLKINGVIAGFRRKADGNCVLLGFYAASSPNPLKMGPIGCHETSARNYHYSLRNNPEKRHSQNEWSYTSTPPPLYLHGTHRDKFTVFTFATYAVCFQHQTDFKCLFF